MGQRFGDGCIEFKQVGKVNTEFNLRGCLKIRHPNEAVKLFSQRSLFQIISVRRAETLQSDDDEI